MPRRLHRGNGDAAVIARQRSRLQQISRVCAAVKTSQFLLDHNAAVPSTMHRWLVTAARRANKASTDKAPAMVVPLVPSIAMAVTPAAGSPNCLSQRDELRPEPSTQL
jgi:hypothetical protein